MDRLDQLFARSKREIEAHTDELGDTETGRYFIDEAAQLLAALRLWAQNQDRTDHVVRDILERGDVGPARNLSERHRRPMQPRDRHLEGCVRGRAEVAAGRPRQRAHADLAGPKGQPAVLPGFCRRWVRAVWRRPVPAVRTAMARALRLPASTTRRLARVTAV